MPFPTHEDLSLAINRQNTIAFIDDNPVWVEFRRPGTTQNENGGVEQSSETVLPPQKVRLVPESIRNVSFGGLGSAAGPQTAVSVAMIAEWDADVQRGDYFHVAGNNFVYEVVYMYDLFELPRQYEIRAGLMERG